MNSRNISIATITLARDEAEETLLKESLQELANLHLPVYITDGGSLPQFLEFLKSFPNFIVSTNAVKGVWAQAKNSLLEASESKPDFIIYTEPDKKEFFKNGLASLVAIANLNDQTGVVLASRSNAGFATFPAFQQMTETTINNCCAEVTGKALEYTYGPFLLNPTLVPYLHFVKEDIGWGWRPYIFNVAHRLGLHIESFVGDFFCPEQQRSDNQRERIYRMKQLDQNIRGIILSTTVDLSLQ